MPATRDEQFNIDDVTIHNDTSVTRLFVTNHWTGLEHWTGLDYWTDIFLHMVRLVLLAKGLYKGHAA